MKLPPRLGDSRRAFDHGLGDAMNIGRALRNGTLRINQGVEHFSAHAAAIDDAHRRDLNDFVSGWREAVVSVSNTT